MLPESNQVQRRLRILLLAGTEGLADEGARNISAQMARLLAQRHDVVAIPASRVGTIIRRAATWRPDIVHSIHGPSVKTLMLMAALRLVCPRARFFASLTQPSAGLLRDTAALRAFTFVRLLSQEEQREAHFARLGFRTTVLPNGIDTERFDVADPALIPQGLAARLMPGKRILLHVGHLKMVRGVQILADIAAARPDWQVLMVASKRFPGEAQAVQTLTDAGCTIYQEFVENLPALYCRADAYVFPPTDPFGSIDMPLTVLEAMACNRPVLSTPYKALPRFLPEGRGVYYFRSIEEAVLQLNEIAAGGIEVRTREQVLPFSWDRVLRALDALYRGHAPEGTDPQWITRSEGRSSG